MSDCLFCRIIAGDIPANICFESDDVIAFNDINPQAPTHVLIIPRQHIPTINDLSTEHADLIANLHLSATHLAKQFDLANDGYRLVFNCNANGGQEVYHIHMHLLGGRRLQWPPG